MSPRTALLALGVTAAVLAIAWGTKLVAISEPVQEGERQSLSSLGYIGAVKVNPEDLNKRGVVRYRPESTAGGLNLYVPTAWGAAFTKEFAGFEPSREAILMDMEGEELREWSVQRFGDDGRLGWAMADFGPTGDLYAVHAHRALYRLNWDNEVVWALDGNVHHDFDFDRQGDIWVLTERVRTVEFAGHPVRLVDQGVAVVSGADGRVVRRFWMYEHLVEQPFFRKYMQKRLGLVEREGKLVVRGGHTSLSERLSSRPKDWLHANTAELMANGSEHWDEGDFMTCLALANMVVVFDKDDFSVRWHWAENALEHPHDPSLTADGTITVFDNGKFRRTSAVKEVEPTTKELVWMYEGTELDPFFSAIRGLAQRLSNGNTLITSSQEGRVLEVTVEGEIVWEWYNPDLIEGKMRVPIRMVRLDADTTSRLRARLGA